MSDKKETTLDWAVNWIGSAVDKEEASKELAELRAAKEKADTFDELAQAIKDALPKFSKLIKWVDWDKEKDEPSNECWCTDTGTEWGDGILRCEQCYAKAALAKLEELMPKVKS